MLGGFQLQIGGRALVSELASLPLALTGPEASPQPGLENGVLQEAVSNQTVPFLSKSGKILGNDSESNWQLEGQVGQGSFGEVWKAVRRSLQEEGKKWHPARRRSCHVNGLSCKDKRLPAVKLSVSISVSLQL